MNDSELLEQFQIIMQGVSDMESRLETKLKESETRTRVFIENTVTKRIDALFDGYKLTHEKQWELERQTQALETQIADLQIRLTALEEKTA